MGIDSTGKCSKTASKRDGVLGAVCSDSGVAFGQCVAVCTCRAKTATTPGGGSMNINPGAIGQLLSGIAQIMGMINGGAPAGGGGGGGAGGIGGGTQGCTQFYQVSTPSSDPCAIYVPPVSNSINIDTGTGNSSGSGGSGNSIDQISSLINSNNTNSNSNSNTSNNSSTSSAQSGIGSGTIGTGTGGTGISSTTAGSAAGLGPGGASGEIRVLPNGTTVVVSNQNTQGNSVVAGFLGTQAGGGAQPQGIAAQWCRTRPWATNFLSFIIPASFFDGLCSLEGYRVGEPPSINAPAQIGSQVTLTQTRIPAKIATTSTPVEVPASPPVQADIWASPETVPLGSRTTIFWNSKNAVTCIETSPDGSFSHSALSGGGATVPLSGPTTFTISCTAPDGTHATDYVTVQMAI